jgi:hypothetical protein
MKKTGLQVMIKTIIQDESIRARFSSNPISVISDYKLSRAEQKAVLNPKMKTMLASGDSTVSIDGILESWF